MRWRVLLVGCVLLVTACTSPGEEGSDGVEGAGRRTPEVTATPTVVTPPSPAPPKADPALTTALVIDGDVAAFGLGRPTLRSSKPDPVGLERCEDVPGALAKPQRAETVAWTTSSPATEVVHSVARYGGDTATKGMTALNEIVSWCPWREGYTGATHRHPVSLGDVGAGTSTYGVCYVWVSLTWCNLVLRRGELISAVRLSWGAGSKLSLAAVPQLAAAAARRLPPQ